MNKKTLIARKEKYNAFLDKAYAAYDALLSGQVKSYAIGSRNLTKFDLPQLEETIAYWEKKVEEIDAQLAGTGRRRTVAVVPRNV